MEKVKYPKAIWDSAAHSIYMDVCVEEVRANNRAPRGTTLSDVGQANLLTKFNERSGRGYSHLQLKNRWDACRGDYAIWKTLVQKASGIGRNPYTKTIAATNEWWALELKVPLLFVILLNWESCVGFFISFNMNVCYFIAGTSES